MYQLKEILLIYLTGGLTFIPILLAVLYFSSSTYKAPLSTQSSTTQQEEEEKPRNPYAQQEKKGWIRLTKRYKPKGTSESNVAVLMSGIQSYVQGSKRTKEHVYAQLKCGALFIYESDQPHEECKIIIPIHNYTVSIYPEKGQDHDIFGRSIALRLTPKRDNNNKDDEILLKEEKEEEDTTSASSPHLTTNSELFITCARPVDKEDWYFGLLAATEMMTESPTSHVEMMDKTHFDASAMNLLISTVQQDAEYREVQWLNAILGRLFLGLYKTDEMRQYFQEKISKKINKIKRPSFLGEITVQSVDIGNGIPFVTQPKLLSLTPEGDLLAEAKLHYAGGLRVVIQTDFNWTYSSLMKPIKIPLVLSVTLKKLAGKFMLKIKPPPTNRYWIGFYELPVMDWEITPIVSDKQIRLSMVTNAIQGKIRESMMENVVLPNLDDFPFCPSGGKGGIFGERVPKPSSPEESSTGASPALSMDMLGNKVNPVPPPKVVITQDSLDLSPKPPTRRAESLSALLDTPSLITDQTMRNRRSKSTSPSDSHHLAAVTSMLRSRGYSNPDILLRPAGGSSEIKVNGTVSEPQQEEEKEVAITTTMQVEEEESIAVATTPPPSFTRRLSSNIVGFRKKHLQQQQQQQQQEVVMVEDEGLPDEPESYFPLDTTNKKEVVQQEEINATATTVITASEAGAVTPTSATTPLATIQVEEIKKEKEEIIIQQPQQPIKQKQQDDAISIKSNKSTTTKINILSKVISNKISSSTTKIINHSNTKKSSSALYYMAGNMFTSSKKSGNKVTREMRDERNRELQESHNRKMMNLFITSPPTSPSSLSSSSETLREEEVKQERKRNISMMPPPLPPRPTTIKTTTFSSASSAASSLSSSEEEEEEVSSSPEEEKILEPSVDVGHIDLKQQQQHKEKVFIVNHHHQEHGLSLL